MYKMFYIYKWHVLWCYTTESKRYRKAGGGGCTIRFEPVIETVENSMLTHQRLHRGKLKGNSGTAHIFWYMMDEDVHF